MKCDELKYEKLGDMMPFYPRSTLVIRKQFVDAAIDELKAENAKLKAKLETVNDLVKTSRKFLDDAKKAFDECKNLVELTFPTVESIENFIKVLNDYKHKHFTKGDSIRLGGGE